MLLLSACSLSVCAQNDEFVSPRFRNQLPPPVTTPPPTPPPVKETPAPQAPDLPADKKEDSKAETGKAEKTKGDKASNNKEDKKKTTTESPYDKVKVEAKAPPTYTYNTERRYTIIHELNGEQFMPAQYQLGTNDVAPLYPGDVNITITPQSIRFEGVKDLSELQILSKFVDRIGYVYELMDKKGQPARFKVVLDQDKYVSLLYFYSKTLGEHTFFLAQKEAQDRAAELNHFTPKSELFVRAYQSLLDVKVQPYTMQKDYTTNEKPMVLKPSDNISFDFKEATVGTPQGTFSIKKANTYAYNMEEMPSVTSVVEIQTQGKPGKVLIYLNYKQQIEFIEVGTARYFLMP
jgi:hypothetical protein